jgi:putative DNA primase/helicase
MNSPTLQNPNSIPHAILPKPGPILPAPTIPEEDLPRAEAFIEFLDGDAKFITNVGKMGRWYLWDGNHWTPDPTEAGIYELTKKCLGRWVSMAESCAASAKNQTEFKRWMRLARTCQKKATLENMIALARKHPEIGTLIENFDTDPWLFGVQNGVVDLRTGELRPAEKKDLILKKSPVTFDADAKCPLWEQTLQRIMPAEGQIEYYQRMCGYMLTGSVTEQVFFFEHGEGQNGKSTVTATHEYIMGDYAWRASSSLFLEARNATNDDNLKAGLPGKRMVIGSEIPTSCQLAEGRIKDLTGGDSVNARLLFNEAFNFMPVCKLVFYGNNKPNIRGTDDGIWRRIRFIPFDVQIPEEERNIHIQEQLRAEAPGILNWMIRGCLEWQKHGLSAPECVLAATQAYRAEENHVLTFVDDECKREGEISKASLYSAYQMWAESHGIKHPFNMKAFGNDKTTAAKGPCCAPRIWR